MIGVSPAYIFSSYTTDFTVHDYASALKPLKRMGFTGFQLEIFAKERLDEWERGCTVIVKEAADLNLQATQFVAHFLLSATANESSLLSDHGFEEMKRVTDIVSNFTECKTITLPLSPFSLPSNAVITTEMWKRLWDGLSNKLLKIDEIVKRANLRLGLELVPGSLLGGTEGLMRFIHETGNSTIGYNFDTGHAWSSKEHIATIPAKLAGRIYGTHLKDNFGDKSLALPPGRGSIPWESVLNGLLQNGYGGSFDLEIASNSPSLVEEEYSEGKNLIERILRNAKEASV